MKITSIQQQQKQTNRYSIFVDGTYRLSLSDLGLLESGIRVGQELDEKSIANLAKKAEIDSFYSRVLNYIAIRPRSKWEVEIYLKRKKYPSDISQKILQKLIDKKLIDDKKFAQSWINNRRLLKPVSKRRLISELRAKRVSNDQISEALNMDETSEPEVLKQLIQQKRKITRYRDDKKLMQYLARQGFNYEDIRQALDS